MWKTRLFADSSWHCSRRKMHLKGQTCHFVARGKWPWLVLRRYAAYHGGRVPVPSQPIVPRRTSWHKDGRMFVFDRLPCAKLQEKTSRSSDEGETLLAWLPLTPHEATDLELAAKFRFGNFGSSTITVRISHPVIRICLPPCKSTSQDIVSLRLSRQHAPITCLTYHVTSGATIKRAMLKKWQFSSILSISSIKILAWIYGCCDLPHHGSSRGRFIAKSASGKNLWPFASCNST